MGESWVLDWGTVLAVENLIELAQKLEYPIRGTDQTCKPSGGGLIDSGDFTDEVYKVCSASGGMFFPSKGSGALVGTWSVTDLKNYTALFLYTYTDFQAKVSLYLEKIAKRRPPLLHFPGDVSEDFLLGHMGQRIIEAEKGRGKTWKKVAGDHYGDCSKLNLVCWWILKQHFEHLQAENIHA
jgi:hypothetical protein